MTRQSSGAQQSTPDQPDKPSARRPRPARVVPARLIYATTAGLAAIWLLLDQSTKALAEATLPQAPQGRIDLGVLDLRLVYNEGAAFGIPGFPGLFVIVSVVVVFLVARALPRTDRLSLAAAYGLVTGGALGNLVDRIFRPPYFPSGAVVDFIDLRWWPVFNFADVGIVAGAALIALLLTLIDREERALEHLRADHRSVRPDTTAPRR
jgi:signal peptidase II